MSDAFITRRGGGGGLSTNNAVLHVNAPVGSTITLAKGGVTVKVLGAGKGHTNADDEGYADWYYSVSPSNYGVWTITAEKDGETTSKTVTVEAVRQYDVELIFGLYLIKNGSFVGDYSFPRRPSGGSSVSITFTERFDGNDYMRVAGGYYLTGAWENIDLAAYKQIAVDGAIVDTPSSSKYVKIGAFTSALSSDTLNNREASAVATATLSQTMGRVTVDLTGVSDVYPGICLSTGNIRANIKNYILLK